jgi:hypothetical protein
VCRPSPQAAGGVGRASVRAELAEECVTLSGAGGRGGCCQFIGRAEKFPIGTRCHKNYVVAICKRYCTSMEHPPACASARALPHPPEKLKVLSDLHSGIPDLAHLKWCAKVVGVAGISIQ